MYEHHRPTLSGQAPLPHSPAVYQPQPLAPLTPQHLAPADPDTRRALVQLDDGTWVPAYVPAAPPVIVPAAPAPARRPLTALERGAITVVGSVCALTLSAGGALAMAGPYLAHLAQLAFGTAALLGAGAVGWLVLRSTTGRGTSPAAAPAAAPQPAPIVITGTGGDGGRWMSRGGTGVRIDRLTIKN